MVDTGYVFVFEWLPSPVCTQVRWIWIYGCTITSQDTHPHTHLDWGALPFARLWVWICVVYGDAVALLQSALTCRHAVLPRTECVLIRKQMERCQYHMESRHKRWQKYGGWQFRVAVAQERVGHLLIERLVQFLTAPLCVLKCHSPCWHKRSPLE